MKKTKAFLVSTFLIGGLVACGTNSATPDDENTDNTPSNGEEVGQSPSNEIDGPVNDDPDINDEQMILIPEIKELEFEVEGQIEKRIAHLTVSDLNYSLFVLEGYSLEAEESGRDVILFDFDNEFFVRIEPLGKKGNVNEIKDSIIAHAQGEVQEGHRIPMKDSKYSILEIIDSETEYTTIIHVAKEFNGNLFKFTMFLPAKEAAEGAEPSFWAMLDTLSAGE